MNITHTKMSTAAPGEHFCGYSLVRRVAAGFLLASAVMATAVAGPRDRDERDNRVAQAQAQAQAQMQRDGGRYEQRAQPRQDDRRQFDARSFESRADEQRRSLQMQEQGNQDAFRRSGRLTPDERRDLRRQINEAGMDLYPNRPRR